MILAKIKDEYKKVIETNELEFFVEPDIQTEKQFENRINLENDEWFYIEIDPEHEMMITNYSDNFGNTVGLNDITDDEFGIVEVLFQQLEDEKIVFQKITPSKRLIHKKYLKKKHADKVEVNTIEHGIELSERVDAYFDGDKKLYFKKFSTIKSMFECIECYYRTASKEEIENFKKYAIVSLGDNLSDFGDANMKMVAIIADHVEIDLDDDAFKSKLMTEAARYNGKFQINNGQFQINKKTQLKDFLKLAIGELYPNPMTNEKMEASSAKRI